MEGVSVSPFACASCARACARGGCESIVASTLHRRNRNIFVGFEMEMGCATKGERGLSSTHSEKNPVDFRFSV